MLFFLRTTHQRGPRLGTRGIPFEVKRVGCHSGCLLITLVDATFSNPRVHVSALSPKAQKPRPRPTTHPPTYTTTIDPVWTPPSREANTKHSWSARIVHASVGRGGLLAVNRWSGHRPQHTWCHKRAQVTRVRARQSRLARWPYKCARGRLLAY